MQGPMFGIGDHWNASDRFSISQGAHAGHRLTLRILLTFASELLSPWTIIKIEKIKRFFIFVLTLWQFPILNLMKLQLRASFYDALLCLHLFEIMDFFWTLCGWHHKPSGRIIISMTLCNVFIFYILYVLRFSKCILKI